MSDKTSYSNNPQEEKNISTGHAASEDGLIPEKTDQVSTQLLPDQFSHYTYSKKSHFEFFKKNNYDRLLYGRDIGPEDCDIKTYQNLLIFSFITQNIPEGSRILEIGGEDNYILNHFRQRYECWKIEDTALMIDDNEIIRKNKYKLLKDNKGHYHSEIFFSCFDFIFSTSGFEKVIDDKSLFKQVLDKINSMLKADSYSLHCFPAIMIDDRFHYHRLLNYFSNHSYELFYPVRSLTALPDIKEMSANSDLYYSFEKYEKAKQLHLDEFQNTVSYNFLWIKKNIELAQTILRRTKDSFEKNRIYFFHHLVKCGGTSIKEVLSQWFQIENDYLERSNDLNKFLKYKINLLSLVSESCIVGHFQYEKIKLHQRYPEVFNQTGKYRVFTFIRDPLHVRYSMFYYNKNLFDQQNIDLLSSMKYFPLNYLADLLACNENNYKEVLDRYFFIGIVEKMQESFDKLAELLGKKKMKLPFLNRSKKDSQISELPESFISQFRKENMLDYKIYEYCLEKFKKINTSLKLFLIFVLTKSFS